MRCQIFDSLTNKTISHDVELLILTTISNFLAYSCVVFNPLLDYRRRKVEVADYDGGCVRNSLCYRLYPFPILH